MSASEPPALLAAGSLRAAFEDLFAGSTDRPRLVFGPSGLLRERVGGGAPAALFAAANREHPARLHAAGQAEAPVSFAANRLVALTRADLGLTRETLIPRLMDEDLTIGTSTPGADPSGDYARQAIARADAVMAGASDRLAAKALALTGGRDTPAPPHGPSAAEVSPYGALVRAGAADLFLTYRTNSLAAVRADAGLMSVELPAPMAVESVYCLCVMTADRDRGTALADRILSAAGRAILHEHGFATP